MHIKHLCLLNVIVRRVHIYTRIYGPWLDALFDNAKTKRGGNTYRGKHGVINTGYRMCIYLFCYLFLFIFILLFNSKGRLKVKNSCVKITITINDLWECYPKQYIKPSIVKIITNVRGSLQSINVYVCIVCTNFNARICPQIEICQHAQQLIDCVSP